MIFKFLHKKVLSAFLFLLILNNGIFAQNEEVIENFSLLETQGSVFLSWTIVEGYTCNGNTIFRSSDNLNFIKIGEIPGVCGSLSKPKNYSFKDDYPEQNSFNYYKIKPGYYQESEVLSIELINIKNNGYQLRPNPAKDLCKIYFDNDHQEPFRIDLYSEVGALVLTRETVLDHFNIEASELAGGVYIFSIYRTSNISSAINGRLIVSR